MRELDYAEEAFINEIIEKFCGPDFTDINDVTTENLREFLVPILENYQKGNIDYGELLEIYDILEFYFLILNEEGTNFENSDPRSIGVEAMECMNLSNKDFLLFPEDVPYFIEFLKTPLGQELEAHQKLKEYVSQFDRHKRSQEAHERGYIHYTYVENVPEERSKEDEDRLAPLYELFNDPETTFLPSGELKYTESTKAYLERYLEGLRQLIKK